MCSRLTFPNLCKLENRYPVLETGLQYVCPTQYTEGVSYEVISECFRWFEKFRNSALHVNRFEGRKDLLLYETSVSDYELKGTEEPSQTHAECVAKSVASLTETGRNPTLPMFQLAEYQMPSEFGYSAVPEMLELCR